MKTIILSFTLLLSLCCFACKDKLENPIYGKGLVGIWQLKEQSGGYDGETTTFSDNPKYLLQITTDSMYIETEGGTITFSDSIATYIDSLYKVKVIDFVNSPRHNMIIEHLSPYSLTLWDGAYDGYSFTYERTQ